MSAAEAVAACMFLALAAYALTGGADFGAGVWDLFASGPRRDRQRELVEGVLAPVWEANHVWLIFFIVLLFSGFPVAFAAAGTALHVPLTLMLLGIVARGCAFTFRHYGAEARPEQLRYGRVFAIASVVTPVFLGMSLGAVSAGGIRLRDGLVVTGFVEGWLRAFPLAVGLTTLALFAFLAATYLTLEASETELQGDFRNRALASGAALALTAGLTAALAPHGAPVLAAGLLASGTGPLVFGAGALAFGASVAGLLGRRYHLARGGAVGTTLALLGGWALAQHPYVIVPDLTLESAAAPPHVLRMLVGVALGGVALVAPALYLLFRVFRARALLGEAPGAGENSAASGRKKS